MDRGLYGNRFRIPFPVEFVAKLKKNIQAFPKIRIKHPFLKAVCNGAATMDRSA
jgi:hypothetical protein